MAQVSNFVGNTLSLTYALLTAFIISFNLSYFMFNAGGTQAEGSTEFDDFFSKTYLEDPAGKTFADAFDSTKGGSDNAILKFFKLVFYGSYKFQLERMIDSINHLCLNDSFKVFEPLAFFVMFIILFVIYRAGYSVWLIMNVVLYALVVGIAIYNAGTLLSSFSGIMFAMFGFALIIPILFGINYLLMFEWFKIFYLSYLVLPDRNGNSNISQEYYKFFQGLYEKKGVLIILLWLIMIGFSIIQTFVKVPMIKNVGRGVLIASLSLFIMYLWTTKKA